MIGWHFLGCLAVTFVSWLLWSWADHYLFTFLGEAEINGEWKMCYMYHTLTIPARLVAVLVGFIGIALFVIAWMTFITAWVF